MGSCDAAGVCPLLISRAMRQRDPQALGGGGNEIDVDIELDKVCVPCDLKSCCDALVGWLVGETAWWWRKPSSGATVA